MSILCNAMSVDVEDYFQVSAFEPYIDKAAWGQTKCRVEHNVDQILDLFSENGIKATFFTLGWIAQRYPEMTKKIVAEGHELASHGWEHIRVSMQNRSEFSEDVIRTKNLLEELTGEQVKGYRAASYSIGAENLWALDVLAEAGHLYSSSIVPVKHDHYGMPEAPRFAFKAASDRILEIPISTVKVAGRQMNCGGGGWFRLFPYVFSQWAINQINEKERQSAIFYFHPWEIDPGQPRLQGLDTKTRFRHYLNLNLMHARLQRLLADFRWGRMDEVFEIEGG